MKTITIYVSAVCAGGLLAIALVLAALAEDACQTSGGDVTCTHKGVHGEDLGSNTAYDPSPTRADHTCRKSTDFNWTHSGKCVPANCSGC